MSTRVPAALLTKNTSQMQRTSRNSEILPLHIRWDRLALFSFCAAIHAAWITAVVALFR